MLHNKRKIILVFVIICLIGLVGVGISYAYWKFTYIQTDNNIAISKCLKLDMTNESNEINLTNMYPISDEEGRKLTPYSFKITNTCSMSAEYKVNLEMLEGTTLNSKYLASLVNNDDIKLLSSYDSAKTTISDSVESRTLDTNILTPGASKEYSISLWMDKSVTLADDAQNKSFSAKVVIDAYMYTGIVDKIVAQLDTSGKCPTVNDDGSVNVTGAESENSLLCSAPDNYGTSYYYRGNVQNNYVKFGGFYWRIVRINGDGSIRMIYDGTSAHENGETSEDRQIGYTAFNDYWKKDNIKESTNSHVYYDNAGIGYMYGNRTGVVEQSTQYSTSLYTNTNTYYIAKEYNYNVLTDKFTLKDPIAVLGSAMTSNYIGYYTFNGTNSSENGKQIYKIINVTSSSSSTTIGYGCVRYGTTNKEKAQENINSSDIKTYSDAWYENNIKRTTNEQYIRDNLFCNDRSISVNEPNGYSNKGYGIEKTSYRWDDFADNAYNNKMLLMCPQKNDAFTVSDTNKGNGSLEYGIGLITTDEVVLAGGWSSANLNYYLYNGQDYWTLSPINFSGHTSHARFVNSDGVAQSNYTVNGSIGTRPVLNLSSDSLKSGDGTINNPYTVE